MIAALGGEARAGSATTEYLGQGDGKPSISDDGQLVVFSALVPTGLSEIFLSARQAGTRLLVSKVSCAGKICPASNGSSLNPQVSAGGRFVVFTSSASNLVTGDRNGNDDVFVRDLRAGTTERVSVGVLGAQANSNCDQGSISADGRYVAFASAANNLVLKDFNNGPDVFVRDRQLGITTLGSMRCVGGRFCKGGNFASVGPAISADGRLIAFSSVASNLVPGGTNGLFNQFVFDRTTLQNTRVSVGLLGVQSNGPSYYGVISSDDRYVAFTSEASNLVLSDTNSVADVFVYDRLTNGTTRVSVSTGEVQGNGNSTYPSISADGRFVAFHSAATNLAGGDTNKRQDVFVRDQLLGTTTRASLSAFATQGNASSRLPAISANGHFVAFNSKATDLSLSGDIGIFVRTLAP
jgi:Tol biopolymer transport system component